MAGTGGGAGSISMIVKGRYNQESAVYRICGYPWKLRVFWRKEDNTRHNYRRHLSLICLKSCEAELWQCGVRILYPEIFQDYFFLKSWEGSHEIPIDVGQFYKVVVRIAVDRAGDRFASYPMRCLPLDAKLVFGKGRKKKTIEVSRESLASQSRYFERLFYGEYRQETVFLMANVEFEEFFNIYKLVYRLKRASLTNENVHRVLELAFDFKLKIVLDQVITFLISPSCPVSIHQKLLITEQYDIPFLKNHVFMQYNYDMIEGLSNSEEWKQVSKNTIRELLLKFTVFDFSSY